MNADLLKKRLPNINTRTDEVERELGFGFVFEPLFAFILIKVVRSAMCLSNSGNIK